MMSAEHIDMQQPKQVEVSPPSRYQTKKPKDSGVSEPTAATSNYLTFDGD